MTEDFNKWWDSEGIAEDNSYREGSPVFWAWEGWQAAVKAEREWQGLTDEEAGEIWAGIVSNAPSGERLRDFARAIEALLKEKNSA